MFAKLTFEIMRYKQGRESLFSHVNLGDVMHFTLGQESIFCHSIG